MMGTLVNVATIIMGSIIGTFLRVGIPDRYKTIIMQGLSLSVMIIGLSNALKYNNLLLVIISLVIGGIIGEIIDIENLLNHMGNVLQKKIDKSIESNKSNISKGFITASLVFCIGAMAIVGSLKDGLIGDHSILYAKSMLDGVASIIFASTFGIGVLFSSITVFVYQGTITLLAYSLKGFLVNSIIADMSAVGGILIVGISLNMLEIKNIKVGNLLPAIFIPMVYHLIILIFHL